MDTRQLLHKKDGYCFGNIILSMLGYFGYFTMICKGYCKCDGDDSVPGYWLEKNIALVYHFFEHNNFHRPVYHFFEHNNSIKKVILLRMIANIHLRSINNLGLRIPKMEKKLRKCFNFLSITTKRKDSYDFPEYSSKICYRVELPNNGKDT